MKKILFLLCLFSLALTGCDNDDSNKKWGTLAWFLSSPSSSGPAQRTVQQPFALYNHRATRLLNGDVLIAGGWNEFGNESFNATVYRAGSTKTFDDLPSGLSGSRVFGAQTLMTFGGGRYPAGSVLITGGGWSDETDAYDPIADDIVGAPDMDGRWGHTATEIRNSGTLYDGKILIVGGQTLGGFASTTKLFDPNTGTFSTVGGGELRRYRANHTATLLADGRVLVTGGHSSVGVTFTAETFDPGTGTFSLTQNTMSEARAYHAAVYLDNKTPTPDDDAVLIVGGYDENGFLLDSAQFFNPRPSMNRFLSQPSTTLQEPVFFHTATALPDTVLHDAIIVGGFRVNNGWASRDIVDGSQPTAQIAVFQYSYDPNTDDRDGIFIRTNDLLTARGFHTTTHLDGRTLLIVGGLDENGDVLSMGEEYDY